MIGAIVCGIVMLALLALDLVLKMLAVCFLKGHAAIPIIPHFIGLNYTENTGIAWGMFGNTPAVMVVITILTVVMIVAIAVLFFTVFKKNTPARVCLAVIEAGAIGNLVDRLCLQYVRDFVDVSSIGFGICNFADFYITFGAVALLTVILFIGKEAVVPLGKNRKRAEEETQETEAHGDGQNGD